MLFVSHYLAFLIGLGGNGPRLGERAQFYPGAYTSTSRQGH